MNGMKRLAAVAWAVQMLMCAGAAMANDAPSWCGEISRKLVSATVDRKIHTI